MELHREFEEMLSELLSENARFLVVGAFAVAQYTEPRYTKDLDIWVEPTPENAERVWRALARFGAPLKGIPASDFTNPRIVYQMGREPKRIDILTGLDVLDFESAWKNRVRGKLGAVTVNFLGRDDLIRAKKDAGRPQDLVDLLRLAQSKSLRPRRRGKRR